MCPRSAVYSDCVFFVCALTGETVQETDKTDNFELNTTNVSDAEPTIDAGQEMVQGAPKSIRSVRFKRRASGKGKLAHAPGGPAGCHSIMCESK